MGKSIDEKVVKLSLDNKDLVSKSQQSLTVMEKLKSAFRKGDALKTDKSISALSELNSKADNVTMDVLKNAIDGVGNKFSTMGVIAATVISNITTKVMGLASSLANQAIFKPMMDGFSEYELKMGSIQTILANTARHGTKLKEVSANLDELNTYADKTIYNFGDMTRNIGLFTNAGIEVGEATQMIKGFSNEAATSGTNAQQASGAAYQLSQALSAGTIRLMDWRSLQNVGMGNKNMQMGLIEITEAMGGFNNTGTDAAQVQKDFNGSLEKGWLSADIMTKYLSIMAEEDEKVNREKMKGMGLTDQQIDQFIKQQKTAQDAATKVRTFSQLIDTMQEAVASGWTETWELVFGDFYDATELWTSMNDIIDPIIAKSAKSRNDFIKDLERLGARQLILDSIANTFKFLGQVMGSMKGAFQKVFPPASAVDVWLVIRAIRDFTASLHINKDALAKLGTVFEGIFSIFSIAIKLVKMVAKAIASMIPDSVGGDVLDLMASIAEYIIQVDKALTPTSKFADILKGMGKAGKQVATFIWNLGSTIVGAFGKIGGLGDIFGKMFGGIGDTLSSGMSKFNFNDVLNATFLVGLIGLSKKIKGVVDTITDSFDGFGKIGESISDAIANIGGLTDVLDNMGRVVNVASIVAIAGSVLMLAVAMRVIANIKVQDIFKALEVLGLGLIGITYALKVISKFNMTGGLKVAVLLQSLAFALLEMSVALKILSTIDPERMGSALLALSVGVGIMVLALKSLSKISKGMVSTSISIVILASAMIVLAGAIAILGYINTDALIQGVVALGVVMLELGVFMKIVNGSRINMGSAVAVMVVSGAIMVMVGAIYLLGNMDVSVLQKGLITVGLILLGFAGLSKVMGNTKSFLGAAVSIGIIAGALTLMVIPLQQMGGMSMESIATGLGTLAGSLTLIVVALKLAKGTLAGAAALAVAAASIALFTPAIMALGQLSLGQIGVALLAIGGTFAIVAAAALLLGPASLALIPFALGIGAVGLALGAVGVIILAATSALTLLAGLTVAGVASIVSSLGLLVLGMTALIPSFVNFGVVAFNGLLSGLQRVFPNIVDTVMLLIRTLLTALNENVPEFVVIGMQFVTSLMTGIAENIGPLIDAGVNLVISLVDGMANAVRDNQDRFVGAIKNMIGAMLELLVTGLEEIVIVMFGWIPGVEKVASGVGDSARAGLQKTFAPDKTAEDAENAIDGFNAGMDGKQKESEDSGAGVAEKAKKGLGSKDATGEGSKLGTTAVTGVQSKSGSASSAGSNVAASAKRGLGSKNASSEGSSLGGGFSGGVQSKGGSASSAGSSVASQAKAGLGSQDASGKGVDLAQGFINGIGSMVSSAWSAASNLADKAIQAIKSKQKSNSPSKITFGLGTDFGDGYINGMDDKSGDVYDSAKDMAGYAIDGARMILSDEASKLASMIDLEPVIKPILDLSNISRARLSELGMSWSAQPVADGGVTNYTLNISAPENDARVIAKEVERIIVRR